MILRPNFTAFYDCIDMIKALVYDKRYYTEKLSRHIRCDFVRDMEANFDLMKIKNISLGPSESKKCLVDYTFEEKNENRHFFHITLKQNRYINTRDFNEKISQNNRHLMVLTCSPPYFSYSSMCPFYQENERGCGVTIGIPFILEINTPLIHNNRLLDSSVVSLSKSTIAISLMIMFLVYRNVILN